jgi:hypothetical protein
MSYIKGEDRNQTFLFPESIDDYIHEDNPVRIIDEYVDQLDMKLSFFPQFIDANSEFAAITMLLYGFIFFVLGLVVLILYAQASSFVRQWLVSKQELEQYFRWVTGTIFVGLGIKLIVPEHR